MFACLVSGSTVNMDCKKIEADRFLFDSNISIKSTGQHLAVFTTTMPSCTWPPGYAAAIYLQFREDTTGEWRYLGAVGEGKDSAFFRVSVPENISSRFDVLTASLGISIVPTSTIINLTTNTNTNSIGTMITTSSSTRSTNSNSNTSVDSLLLAKKLLDNFVNYALSFSRTFPTSPDTNESFIPAKIITDWYNGTVRRAQMDPVGFFNNLMSRNE